MQQESHAATQTSSGRTKQAKTVNQKLARKIMRHNFFGVEEAMRCFKLDPSERDLEFLRLVPFSEAVLEECKDTHILVAVFPLSIMDIRRKTRDHLFSAQSWYDREPFATDIGFACWRLVKKIPMDNSLGIGWEAQKRTLAEGEEVPTARVMVYTIIGHFLSRRVQLFKNVSVRCLSLSSKGHRVHVGEFNDLGGLVIDFYYDDPRFPKLGAASSKKPNSQ